MQGGGVAVAGPPVNVSGRNVSTHGAQPSVPYARTTDPSVREAVARAYSEVAGTYASSLHFGGSAASEGSEEVAQEVRGHVAAERDEHVVEQRKGHVSKDGHVAGEGKVHVAAADLIKSDKGALGVSGRSKGVRKRRERVGPEVEESKRRILAAFLRDMDGADKPAGHAASPVQANRPGEERQSGEMGWSGEMEIGGVSTEAKEAGEGVGGDEMRQDGFAEKGVGDLAPSDSVGERYNGDEDDEQEPDEDHVYDSEEYDSGDEEHSDADEAADKSDAPVDLESLVAMSGRSQLTGMAGARAGKTSREYEQSLAAKAHSAKAEGRADTNAQGGAPVSVPPSGVPPASSSSPSGSSSDSLAHSTPADSIAMIDSSSSGDDSGDSPTCDSRTSDWRSSVIPAVGSNRRQDSAGPAESGSAAADGGATGEGMDSGGAGGVGEAGDAERCLGEERVASGKLDFEVSSADVADPAEIDASYDEGGSGRRSRKRWGDCAPAGNEGGGRTRWGGSGAGEGTEMEGSAGGGSLRLRWLVLEEEGEEGEEEVEEEEEEGGDMKEMCGQEADGSEEGSELEGEFELHASLLHAPTALPALSTPPPSVLSPSVPSPSLAPSHEATKETPQPTPQHHALPESPQSHIHLQPNDAAPFRQPGGQQQQQQQQQGGMVMAEWAQQHEYHHLQPPMQLPAVPSLHSNLSSIKRRLSPRVRKPTRFLTASRPLTPPPSNNAAAAVAAAGAAESLPPAGSGPSEEVPATEEKAINGGDSTLSGASGVAVHKRDYNERYGPMEASAESRSDDGVSSEGELSSEGSGMTGREGEEGEFDWAGWGEEGVDERGEEGGAETEKGKRMDVKEEGKVEGRQLVSVDGSRAAGGSDTMQHPSNEEAEMEDGNGGGDRDGDEDGGGNEDGDEDENGEENGDEAERVFIEMVGGEGVADGRERDTAKGAVEREEESGSGEVNAGVCGTAFSSQPLALPSHALHSTPAAISSFCTSLLSPPRPLPSALPSAGERGKLTATAAAAADEATSAGAVADLCRKVQSEEKQEEVRREAGGRDSEIWPQEGVALARGGQRGCPSGGGLAASWASSGGATSEVGGREDVTDEGAERREVSSGAEGWKLGAGTDEEQRGEMEGTGRAENEERQSGEQEENGLDCEADAQSEDGSADEKAVTLYEEEEGEKEEEEEEDEKEEDEEEKDEEEEEEVRSGGASRDEPASSDEVTEECEGMQEECSSDAEAVREVGARAALALHGSQGTGEGGEEAAAEAAAAAAARAWGAAFGVDPASQEHEEWRGRRQGEDVFEEISAWGAVCGVVGFGSSQPGSSQPSNSSSRLTPAVSRKHVIRPFTASPSLSLLDNPLLTAPAVPASSAAAAAAAAAVVAAENANGATAPGPVTATATTAAAGEMNPFRPPVRRLVPSASSPALLLTSLLINRPASPSSFPVRHPYPNDPTRPSAPGPYSSHPSSPTAFSAHHSRPSSPTSADASRPSSPTSAHASRPSSPTIPLPDRPWLKSSLRRSLERAQAAQLAAAALAAVERADGGAEGEGAEGVAAGEGAGGDGMGSADGMGIRSRGEGGVDVERREPEEKQEKQGEENQEEEKQEEKQENDKQGGEGETNVVSECNLDADTRSDPSVQEECGGTSASTDMFHSTQKASQSTSAATASASAGAGAAIAATGVVSGTPVADLVPVEETAAVEAAESTAAAAAADPVVANNPMAHPTEGNPMGTTGVAAGGSVAGQHWHVSSVVGTAMGSRGARMEGKDSRVNSKANHVESKPAHVGAQARPHTALHRTPPTPPGAPAGAPAGGASGAPTGISNVHAAQAHPGVRERQSPLAAPVPAMPRLPFKISTRKGLGSAAQNSTPPAVAAAAAAPPAASAAPPAAPAAAAATPRAPAAVLVAQQKAQRGTTGMGGTARAVGRTGAVTGAAMRRSVSGTKGGVGTGGMVEMGDGVGAGGGGVQGEAVAEVEESCGSCSMANSVRHSPGARPHPSARKPDSVTQKSPAAGQRMGWKRQENKATAAGRQSVAASAAKRGGSASASASASAAASASASAGAAAAAGAGGVKRVSTVGVKGAGGAAAAGAAVAGRSYGAESAVGGSETGEEWSSSGSSFGKGGMGGAGGRGVGAAGSRQTAPGLQQQQQQQVSVSTSHQSQHSPMVQQQHFLQTLAFGPEWVAKKRERDEQMQQQKLEAERIGQAAGGGGLGVHQPFSRPLFGERNVSPLRKAGPVTQGDARTQPQVHAQAEQQQQGVVSAGKLRPFERNLFHRTNPNGFPAPSPTAVPSAPAPAPPPLAAAAAAAASRYSSGSADASPRHPPPSNPFLQSPLHSLAPSSAATSTSTPPLSPRAPSGPPANPALAPPRSNPTSPRVSVMGAAAASLSPPPSPRSFHVLQFAMGGSPNASPMHPLASSLSGASRSPTVGPSSLAPRSPTAGPSPSAPRSPTVAPSPFAPRSPAHPSSVSHASPGPAHPTAPFHTPVSPRHGGIAPCPPTPQHPTQQVVMHGGLHPFHPSHMHGGVPLSPSTPPHPTQQGMAHAMRGSTNQTAVTGNLQHPGYHAQQYLQPVPLHQQLQQQQMQQQQQQQQSPYRNRPWLQQENRQPFIAGPSPSPPRSPSPHATAAMPFVSGPNRSPARTPVACHTPPPAAAAPFVPAAYHTPQPPAGPLAPTPAGYIGSPNRCVSPVPFCPSGSPRHAAAMSPNAAGSASPAGAGTPDKATTSSRYASPLPARGPVGSMFFAGPSRGSAAAMVARRKLEAKAAAAAASAAAAGAGAGGCGGAAAGAAGAAAGGGSGGCGGAQGGDAVGGGSGAGVAAVRGGVGIVGGPGAGGSAASVGGSAGGGKAVAAQVAGGGVLTSSSAMNAWQGFAGGPAPPASVPGTGAVPCMGPSPVSGTAVKAPHAARLTQQQLPRHAAPTNGPVIPPLSGSTTTRRWFGGSK
ncbi:unnamed protein product [Closterium sp. Naga37s-1]|nr:unnamed protein product [Closterium sp. Naga37s-1]